jgi:hypothetical protein
MKYAVGWKRLHREPFWRPEVISLLFVLGCLICSAFVW